MGPPPPAKKEGGREEKSIYIYFLPTLIIFVVHSHLLWMVGDFSFGDLFDCQARLIFTPLVPQTTKEKDSLCKQISVIGGGFFFGGGILVDKRKCLKTNHPR